MIYVIIPVYNTESYLEECLNSVFEQTVEKRIICVNDGSSDGSLHILEGCQRAHPELTVLSIENGGPSRARNTALDFVFHCFDVSEEDFIAFIDSDDYVAPTYLETLLEAVKRGHNDITCCNFRFYRDGSSCPFSQKPLPGVYSAFEATKELIADRTIQSHSPCKLFRARLWESVRYPESIIAMEDQATIFKVFSKANQIRFIDYDEYYYRQRNESVCSAIITNKRVLDSLEGYLSPCLYEFSEFSEEESKILQKEALNAFALVYLMMIPRFRKYSASPREMEHFERIRFEERRLCAVLRLRTRNRSERTKKYLYLLLRPLYGFLYNQYLQTRNRKLR